VQLNNYHSVYFLGIGGIGMSAIARWFKHSGLKVAGYDKTATPLTHELLEEGMEIHFEDRIEMLPGYINKEKTLVVLTPAVPKDHKEYNYLKDEGFTIMKRSEVLGLLTKNYRTIAVAGTHGKTTTSSLIAHILKSAGKDMVAFLGGITTNYESNLVMQGTVSKDTVMVAEADEFDRSFLRLFPEAAVVTSADADHLDIYGDHASMIISFQDFMRQVKASLIVHESIENLAVGTGAGIQTYGTNKGQFFAENIIANGGFFSFDLAGKQSIKNISLGVPGFHNMENAIAASIVALEYGVTEQQLRDALASFKGVKRRFEFIVKKPNLVYIDDYAHHPTEIEAFLNLFTRTRDFADGFAKSLSIADELLMMDIYPARELPIEGVTSDIIFKHVTSPVKMMVSKQELVNKLSQMNIEVLATVGAGDIDVFVKPIKEMLNKR
jgi:UDP-N-acetylmuramate--alanine ligase